MDFLGLVEFLGDGPSAAFLGLLTGGIFGVAAQRSGFCLRAATIEFAHGKMGPRMAVWLLTFSTALVWVQSARFAGLFDPTEARIMAVAGSWSGAVIGGLVFGVGMVLARGCSGRLLVLAATGNLRSLVSGLVFAVVAQMSLSGMLSPLRDRLAALSTTPGGRNLDLISTMHLPAASGLVLGVGLAGFAIWIAIRNELGWNKLVFASGVGFAVAVGWIGTYSLAGLTFEPTQIESATFTGPSANTLMFLLAGPTALEFDVGLIPGVFAGAFLSSVLAGEFRFQGYEGARPMRQALIGAAFMGFGGMLAGGCAIGAGVSGGSVFAATAWLALTCMWIGAVATERLMTFGAQHAPA